MGGNVDRPQLAHPRANVCLRSRARALRGVARHFIKGRAPTTLRGRTRRRDAQLSPRHRTPRSGVERDGQMLRALLTWLRTRHQHTFFSEEVLETLKVVAVRSAQRITDSSTPRPSTSR